MAESPDKPRPLSEVLEEVIDHDHPQISVAEITQKFGGRAIGALLFVFSLACILPLPPGATTIFGLPLLFIAPQLVIGASAPWLPRQLKVRKIATSDLSSGLPRVLPWLKRLEAVSRPRLLILFGEIGERLAGAVCTALAVVLILPIPLGNMLPAMAIAVLSFSLIQRDGVIALVGYALAVASAGVLALAAHIIVSTFGHAWATFTGA